MYFWISWYQPTEDHRPLTYPPNESVLGWWCSGSTDDSSVLCALVRAKDEDDAKAAITKDWPEANDWRFCNEKPDLSLSDRFMLTDWMEPRFKEARKK